MRTVHQRLGAMNAGMQTPRQLMILLHLRPGAGAHCLLSSPLTGVRFQCVVPNTRCCQIEQCGIICLFLRPLPTHQDLHAAFQKRPLVIKARDEDYDPLLERQRHQCYRTLKLPTARSSTILPALMHHHPVPDLLMSNRF